MQLNKQTIESALNLLNFAHLGGHTEINFAENLKNTEAVLHSATNHYYMNIDVIRDEKRNSLLVLCSILLFKPFHLPKLLIPLCYIKVPVSNKAVAICLLLII